MTHDELTHLIERGNYINTKFENNIKYMSRGVKNGGSFFRLVLKYYHNINKYVSDVELENLRLVMENHKLKNELSDTSNELISGLYKRLKHLNNKLC